MILALCWVPKGKAKCLPDKYEATEEDMQGLMEGLSIDQEELEKEVPLDEKEEEEQDENAEMEEEIQTAEAVRNLILSKEEDEEVTKKYNFDDYDEEGGGVFGLTDGDSYFKSSKRDPYITVQDDEDDSDLEDFTIRHTDALIVAGTAEEDYSHVDVHIYEEQDDNMYVHHDIMLPTYPLCLAWTDFNIVEPSSAGNFVAVGSFEPGIEIWNLDTVDALQPAAILGGFTQPGALSRRQKKNKKKRSSKPKLKPGSHTSAVLGLSWNRHHRHVLASCGEDETVKLWDAGKQECLQTYTHHKDKVQSVKWHNQDAAILVTGGFDKKVMVLDVRQQSPITIWTLTAEVESLDWNPHSPDQVLVSTDDGMVSCFGQNEPSKPLWTFKAHEKAVSALCVNTRIPNYLATLSMDKSFKLWDISDGQPRCLASKETSIGKLFCGAFYEDSPYLLAVGGKKQLSVFNTAEFDLVRERFPVSKKATPTPTSS